MLNSCKIKSESQLVKLGLLLSVSFLLSPGAKMKGCERLCPRALPTNGLTVSITTLLVPSIQHAIFWSHRLSANRTLSICCLWNNCPLASAFPVPPCCLVIQLHGISWSSFPPGLPSLPNGLRCSSLRRRKHAKVSNHKM